MKPFKNSIKNNIGYTLLEILVAISLLAILVSISFVSYRSVTKNIALKNLKQVSELFPTTFNNCITSSGWEIVRPDKSVIFPCSDSDSSTALKKIDYTCPEGSTCVFHSNNTDEYVCLNVQKKVRGNNYEIQVIVNRNNKNDYKILCSGKTASVAAPEGLNDNICKDATTSSYSPCDW